MNQTLPDNQAAPVSANDAAGELSQSEQRAAEQRTALRAAVIHEAIRAEGEAELRRPVSALVWSGLAAGLSMGFSLVVTGLFRAHLPPSSASALIVNLGYSVGFLVVILGRQQLYTENTLTVILPLLTHRDGKTLLKVLRVWGIVLPANVLGALGFAWIASATNVFSHEMRSAFIEIGSLSLAADWSTMLVRGIFAGWLIAMMVWMMPAAESSRVAVIIIMTYTVSLGRFPHVIAGSVDTLFMVLSGVLSWSRFLKLFLVPTLVGNTIGGILLVALFNHAQVVTEEKPERSRPRG